MDYRRWARQFARIGAALTETRGLPDLLSTILVEQRRLTNSDAGSIFRVVEQDGEQRLRFEQAQNDSLDLTAPDQFTLPLDRGSLAGYVSVENEPLLIEDAYRLPDDVPYRFDASFDRETGYRTRSMLVLPLQNRHGETKGVLQLINRKADPSLPVEETEVLSYTEEQLEMVSALASQAAVAMERSELENAVQIMLDSMIQTLVEALDRRDQITTGHSRRLAIYARKLAQAVNSSGRPRWESVEIDDWQLESLHYAGLLHDIGKIAVPEDVLNKRNRLTGDRMEAIRYRLAYLEASGQKQAEDGLYEQLAEINRSGFIDERQEELLEKLRDREYSSPDGDTKKWLTEQEYRHLSVKRGNLTTGERDQIEGHARATFEILQNIEWTDPLDDIPRTAALHHEKLNGEGYPWGVGAEEIPLLARILAVVDIYEALTAQDRPYRDAMRPEQAQDVLEEEAEKGGLDPDLVDLFFAREIYKTDPSESFDPEPRLTK